MKRLLAPGSWLLALVVVAGCKTDKPKELDGGGGMDAGPVVEDAGRAAVVEDAGAAAVDAGAIVDAGAAEPLGNGEKPKATTAFDRILARPKKADFDVEHVRAEVEKKTGLKVTQARKSARKWIFLQFAPTAKGRDAGDQKKLIEALEGTGLFDSVEGDRLMKIKTP